jgi:prepilin-type processing-associated H-X9-DG protein
MRNRLEALVLLLILVVVGGLLVTAVARVREAGAKVQCWNNLRAIGLALDNYQDTNNHFPQAAEPNLSLPPERRLSWLVSIGPYVEATNIFVRMDRQQGWDAEENRYLALTVLRYLQCPSHPDRPPVSTLAPTHYVGITGLGTDAATLPPEDSRAGFFGYDRTLTLPGRKNGTSALLVAIETAQADGAWTAGGWPTVRGLEENGPPYLGIDGQFGGTHRGGANALFADASVRFLRTPGDSPALRAIVTIQGSAEKGAVGEE